MSMCLTILTYNKTKSLYNGEKYQVREHLGLGLIKPNKESDEIINLMRVRGRAHQDDLTIKNHNLNSFYYLLYFYNKKIVGFWIGDQDEVD